jgi:hypothetical protein
VQTDSREIGIAEQDGLDEDAIVNEIDRYQVNCRQIISV